MHYDRQRTRNKYELINEQETEIKCNIPHGTDIIKRHSKVVTYIITKTPRN